ncbi:recombinase family protein [Streptomyces sp. MAI_2237]
MLGGPEKAPESIRSVALDWERRGIVSRQNGVPFRAQNLRHMLTRKAYIGMRVHGASERPGNWPPLIEVETFEAVQRLLADPSRKSHTTNAVRHILTGTLRCDVCGEAMTISTGERAKNAGGHHGHAAYVCRRYGCLRIDRAKTDAFLIGDAQHPGVVLAYLSRPDIADGLSRPGDDPELSRVRAQLSRARALLEEFENAEPARSLAESRERARSVEALEAEIRELEGKERSLTTPNPLVSMFKTGPGAAERWAATEVTAQRAIAALLLSPEVIGRPRVRRVDDSPSDAVTDRINWSRTAGE